MIDLNNLEIGQTVFMADYGDVLRKVPVTKLTKTQITVKTATGHELKFKRNGDKISSFKSSYQFLTFLTEDEAQEKVEQKNYKRIDN